MSGHSKWATTHRQKAVIDSQRSKEFSKLSRLITVAARQKGGDISSNFSLRMLVEKAKDCSMPKDNIDKAIKKGIGEDGDENFEELIYEAIGPFNTQFIVKCLTDSRNRTASDIRYLFSKFGGAMSSVAWNFEQRGVLETIQNINDYELDLIENGALDIQKESDSFIIYCDVKDLQRLKDFFDNKSIKTESAEIKYVPKDCLDLNEEQTQTIEKIVDEIDANDDIVDWWGNF